MKRSECAALPGGWIREEVLRTGGVSAGKFDVYYYPPSGKPKCRSKPEMIKVLGDTIDLSGFDYASGTFTSSIRKPQGNKPKPGGQGQNPKTENLLSSQGENGSDADGAASFTQIRHLTGELSRTTSQLARTVSQVGDTTEFSKVVSATKEVVECNTKILGELKDSLLPVVRNIHDEIREMRRDFTLRDDRYLDVLRKISENTSAAAASAASTAASAAASANTSSSRASDVTSEERLLLESLGLTSGPSSLLQQQLLPLIQQQQMIQQQLARQTPNMMPASMAGYGTMYPGTSVFNPMVSLPNSPVPPQPLMSGGPQQRMMPPLPTVPQPQHVVMNQKPAPAPAAPAASASGSKAAPTNVVIKKVSISATRC